MLGIENQYALVASVIFALSIPVAVYFLSRSETGFGDFSAGITYLDFYSAIIMIVPMVAASSYLLMAFGFGKVENAGEVVHWLRYYEWALSTPLLVMGTLVLTQDTKLMLKGMFADFLMIMAGFLAEMAPNTGLRIAAFFLSSLLFIYLIYLVAYRADKLMENSVDQLRNLFNRLKLITVGLWISYPVVWIMGPDLLSILQGQNLFLAFMVLDIVSKIGYSYFIISRASGVSSGSSGKWL